MCVDGWHERMVEIGDDGSLQFSHRARSDPAVRPDAAAPCATRRSARSSNGAPTRSRWRSAAARATRRRRAGDRLRPCRERGRRHLAGGRPPRLRRSAADARQGRPHRACGFRGAGACGRKHGRPRHGPIEQAHSCAGSASRAARRRCKARRRRQGGRHRLRAGAPDRRGTTGMGAAVQGDWLRASEARPTAGIRANGACQRHHAHDVARPSLSSARRHPPRLLHAPGRRVDGRLREPQWRHRLQRRAGPMSPKTAPAWRRRSASRRTISSPATRSIRPTWSSSSSLGRAEARPRADAIVTRVPGLAIGVSTADCGPVLFADAEARRHRRRACRLAWRASPACSKRRSRRWKSSARRAPTSWPRSAR